VREPRHVARCIEPGTRMIVRRARLVRLERLRRCQGVLASMGAHGRSLATSGDPWHRSSVRWALIRPYTPAVAHARP